jgi:DtxR family Mn-dependent transcriptional regulator
MLDKTKAQAPCSALGQSGEDYLEAVLLLGRESKVVRVKDVADRLGVTRPSVVAALVQLEMRGLVRHERYGAVELTPAGLVRAEAVYRRHRLLYRFLRDVLGVCEAVAAVDACRLEHALSAETVRRLVQLVEFMRRHRENDTELNRELRRALPTARRKSGEDDEAAE